MKKRKIMFPYCWVGDHQSCSQGRGKSIGSKAFIKMSQQYLKGASLLAVKEIFKKVGITFTRKAAEKAIQFGVGVIIGFSSNKGLTWYVGSKAKDFYKVF